MPAQESNLTEIIDTLDEIYQDRSVPKNIRKAVNRVKDTLLNKPCTLAIRLNTALSILDEVSNDPNLPEHTRTIIWDLASTLEGMH
jgi:hypothetical protein